MSMFKRNRRSEVRTDPDKEIAEGMFENDAQAFDPADPNRPPRIQPVAQHWSVNPADQDEIRNAPLTPIPEPGLAIFPNTLSYSLKPRETVLMLTPNWKTNGFEVVDVTGGQPPKPMFAVDNPAPRLKPYSSKRVFSDANTGTKLCVFEKVTHKFSAAYRVLDPSTKSLLVEVHLKKTPEDIMATMRILQADNMAATGKSSTNITAFSNEINDGTREAPLVEGNSASTLEWKGHATELRGVIEYQGELVATIEKKFLITSTEYHARIAQGLDPFLVCVMAAAVEDRRRTPDSLIPLSGVGNSFSI